MSHFSVMVVTDSEPTEETLAEIMQPYHEFECTGIDDKYVQSINVIDEAKAAYVKYVDTKNPASFLVWVKEWYGLKSVYSDSEIDLEEQHKYGFVRVDVDGEVLQVIDRTNPNRKWDYWRVGGRYRSKLQVKEEATSAVSTEPSWEWERQDEVPDGFDSACVADIDWDKMKAVAVQARTTWVDECITKCGMSRDAFGAACQLHKEVHAKWMELPANDRPRGTEYFQWLRDAGYTNVAEAHSNNFEIPEIGEQTLDEWINSAPPLTAFAVVKDGNWYQKGQMGWWACVSDEDDQWDVKFNELVASLQPEQWITFLDCHI